MIDGFKPGFGGVMIQRCQVGQILERKVRLVTQEFANATQAIRSNEHREFTAESLDIPDRLRVKVPQFLEREVWIQDQMP